MPKTTIRMGIHMITDPSMGGGVERWVINTLHDVPENVEISIYSTNYSDQKRLEKEAEYLLKFHGVKLTLMENKLRFFRKSRILSFFMDTLFIPFMIWISSPFYRKKLEQEKVDIVYLTKNQYWRLFRGSIRVGSSHTEFHDQGYLSLLKARLYATGLIYRGITAFHVYPGRSILSSILGRRATILTLPNGTPEIACKASGKESNVRFLYVGRLETIKGIEILVQGWKIAEMPENATLTVVGTGTYIPPDLSSYNIFFKGKLSDDELKKEYCNSDVFFYPTLWDSFPYTVIEAISTGCYVISGNVIRPSFVDAESENAIKFIKSTPEEVSISLKNCIDSIDSLRQDRVKRIEYFRKNYRSESVNEKFFDFVMNHYREFVKNNDTENI